jgi:predicted nucleic acid-binding protein
VVIVDTSVWIDYLGGRSTRQTEWLDRELDRQRLGLTDTVLCEVLQGIRDDRRFEATRRSLLRFEVFETGGIGEAVATARHYRQLRARGRTIRRTADAWIATFCLLNGHSLLHNDRDFDHFEDLLGLAVVQG